MIKFKGGNRVRQGTYWNFSSGERIDLSTDGILPGNGDTTFYRLPAVGIILLAPVLGLLYAAFLPFIGIAMLVKLVVEKFAGGLFVSTRSTASFGWRPSESYLAGKKEKGEKTDKEKKAQEKPEKEN